MAKNFLEIIYSSSFSLLRLYGMTVVRKDHLESILNHEKMCAKLKKNIVYDEEFTRDNIVLPNCTSVGTNLH